MTVPVTTESFPILGRTRQAPTHPGIGTTGRCGERGTIRSPLADAIHPVPEKATAAMRDTERTDAPLANWGVGSPKASRRAFGSLDVCGLFAGIGGIELGLHRAGHRALMLCENDPSATAVLRKRFPGLPIEGDVRGIDSLPRGTQLLAAGFPCQDLSQAGLTRGIRGKRSGLVANVFRLLEQHPVPWVLLENVPFMLQLGRGRALDVIVGRLEALGYRWAYRVVTSQAFGLPHRRERVFLLGSLRDDPREVLLSEDAGTPATPARSGNIAHGFYWTEGVRGLGWGIDVVPTLKGGSTVGIPSPPAILLPQGRVVTPDIRDAERLQGFPDDWTQPAEEVGRASLRWKLVGNAVTVDVAKWIGERLASPLTYGRDGWDTPIPKGSPWPRSAWNMGGGRFASDCSAWPVRGPVTHLHEFLTHEPKPLSARATAGFLERTSRSSLRFPPGFLPKVEAHLREVRNNPGHEERPGAARKRNRIELDKARSPRRRSGDVGSAGSSSTARDGRGAGGPAHAAPSRPQISRP